MSGESHPDSSFRNCQAAFATGQLVGPAGRLENEQSSLESSQLVSSAGQMPCKKGGPEPDGPVLDEIIMEDGTSLGSSGLSAAVDDVQVAINTLDAITICLELKYGNTVFELKQKIQDWYRMNKEKSVPPIMQKLMSGASEPIIFHSGLATMEDIREHLKQPLTLAVSKIEEPKLTSEHSAKPKLIRMLPG